MLKQLQPELNQQLDMALQIIERLTNELSQSHSQHIMTLTAFAELSNATRAYLADPHTKPRLRLESLLAKAPK